MRRTKRIKLDFQLRLVKPERPPSWRNVSSRRDVPSAPYADSIGGLHPRSACRAACQRPRAKRRSVRPHQAMIPSVRPSLTRLDDFAAQLIVQRCQLELLRPFISDGTWIRSKMGVFGRDIFGPFSTIVSRHLWLVCWHGDRGVETSSNDLPPVANRMCQDVEIPTIPACLKGPKHAELGPLGQALVPIELRVRPFDRSIGMKNGVGSAVSRDSSGSSKPMPMQRNAMMHQRTQQNTVA